MLRDRRGREWKLGMIASSFVQIFWLDKPRISTDQLAFGQLIARQVSARLDLPLGVTRVLVGDMADEGMVMVHRPAQGGDRPDLALLERVLYGLRSI